MLNFPSHFTNEEIETKKLLNELENLAFLKSQEYTSVKQS